MFWVNQSSDFIKRYFGILPLIPFLERVFERSRRLKVDVNIKQHPIGLNRAVLHLNRFSFDPGYYDTISLLSVCNILQSITGFSRSRIASLWYGMIFFNIKSQVYLQIIPPSPLRAYVRCQKLSMRIILNTVLKLFIIWN